jgi:hypothetical protein
MLCPPQWRAEKDPKIVGIFLTRKIGDKPKIADT